MKRRIFIFFAGIYLLTLTTPFDSIDGQTMYDTSRALAFEQTFAFPDDFYSPQLRPGKDGRKYSQYDPGLPLLAAPVVSVSDALAESQRWNRYAFSAYMVLWIPVFFAAAGLCGLYALANGLYHDKRKSLLIVFAAGFCTPLWYYARSFFPEGTLAGLLMLAFWLVYRGGTLSIAGAGIALGFMMLIRAPMVIYIAPLLWLLWRTSENRVNNTLANGRDLLRPGRRFIRRDSIYAVRYTLKNTAILLIFPFFAGLALLYHNHLRYGDPFTSGYAYSGQAFNTPFLTGIYGLLFSPGKGVFWYVPVLFLSVWKFPVFYRKNRALAQSMIIATVAVLLLYSRWWAWHGGWCWGPRFLVPILPLWMLPPGEIVWTQRMDAIYGVPTANPVGTAYMLSAHRIKQVIVSILFTLSFLISLLGVITNVNYTYESRPEDVIHYTIAGSPITGALEIVLDTRTEYLSTFYLSSTGMVQTTAILIPAVLLLCVTVSFYGFTKKLNQESLHEQ